MSMARPPPNESWDCMLPGPPSRNNFGSADISPSGLLAFPSGSSISVLDCRSMQLIATLPMPPPGSSPPPNHHPPSNSLSPFVTAVRWTPSPLRRDLLSTDPSTSHLLLAAADRQGRIALLDFRLRTIALWFDTDQACSSHGVQDLCWVQSRSDTYHLAAIIGPSVVSLFNSVSGLCVWTYDAYPEMFSCIRRDPFDLRQFCTIGLKGFLLWAQIHGEHDDDILMKDFQIPTDCSALQRLERDVAGGGSSAASPASAVFPMYSVRFSFSPHWRHIIFVTFPRELLVFDLQYETVLFSVPLPRGCSKFLDVLPDPDKELLYCAHLDGKLTTWRRKGEEQVHVACAMEELMPSIGSSVPCPLVLSVIVFQSNSALHNIGMLYSDGPHYSRPDVDFNKHFEFCDESLIRSKTHLISISDDGKIWKWLLTAEVIGDTQKDTKYEGVATDTSSEASISRTSSDAVSSSDGSALDSGQQGESVRSGRNRASNKIFNQADMLFKISLVGQVQLLSSTVTMLAVPSPSLTATLARGGNYPAVAVPLVALGTQNGTIDIVDVSANAVAASFIAHSGVIRGLRWLGNSRLVSFSYTQVNDKTGGYTNTLVVTCLRSGINRPFRVLQKPERAPIRALRSSSSGRYLLILFRDAPVEVWAMTKMPFMLRSLALPFTVLEWTLPTIPRPSQNEPPRQSSLSRDQADAASSSPSASDSKGTNSDGPQEDNSESFAFALVNGSLGVFEVHGRRIRDFRPKWPSSSFVSSDGLITAMAYRLPHVVMGDRSGNIRWWDVTTGYSSSFNTNREGVRRIKFSPTIVGDCSRVRIAVLFYDNTFSVYDLDSLNPLANSLLQPQLPGTLVLELDWLPLRTDKSDPLVLCIAGADSSFRLVEVPINDRKVGLHRKTMKERFRPMPLCAPILFPTAHALALRMILQLGVKPCWFNTCSTMIDKRPHLIPGTTSATTDLRSYMIDSPPVGDSVVPEMFLKVLEPYRKEGCILDDDNARLYASVVNKGCAARFAFAAAVFGESSEALFWLQLPRALNHLMNKSANKSPLKSPLSAQVPEFGDAFMLSRLTSRGSEPRTSKRDALSHNQLSLMAFEHEELWESANERIPWHEKLEGEGAIQNRVHELVSVGNLECAVSLLLSTPPESVFFYPNALRAVALSSAVSRSLHELAVKVVAANMVRTDRSLSGTHLLCAVGRYQEACSQLQDAGCWTDAATLAASHLNGTDYARVLQRWADHLLRAEHNIWRALILYVAAGALQEALAALRQAHHPDTAAMFILACREIHAEIISNLEDMNEEEPGSSVKNKQLSLPGFNPENVDVIAVGEYYGEYQRKLVHFCMDSQPFSD